MKKFMKAYNDILAYIGVIFLIGFIGAVLVQIVSRTFLPKSPNWTEEASRYLFIFMVGFAGNTAVATDEYVGVDLLTSHFSPKLQKYTKILVLLIIWAFSIVVFFMAVMGPQGLLALTPPAMASTAMRLPMNKVYISVAILYGLYCLSYPMRIYCVVKDIEIYEKGGEA
ncbi:MAG: TRAP transporter small permease subunit [Clostridiales bacterium]|nr:TRAP transporter small permease subunit [Candidatus Blautia equi]